MVEGPRLALDWLALVEQELLLFAGVFFLLGALDEIAVDLIWLWHKFTGKARTLRMPLGDLPDYRLAGRAAVFIPTWLEEQVIGATVAHALRVWKQRDLRLYVGCYRNDPATLQAVLAAAGGDPRLRIVVVDADGPTTKADCLNRLYAAMEQDELRTGCKARMVVLHDAEDMVAPPALALMDRAIELAEFVQLPVLPEPQPQSRWIGSHYCEEFAESHGKAMVVREALGAGLPAAGVGCAFKREVLGEMARQRAADGPFGVKSLTEDYEMGLRVAAAGGRSRFLRVRGDDGRLVATRAYFPSRIDTAVRQKARWIHGICLQGWDRLGWDGGIGERWMRLRDRRGPLGAMVLAAGYLLLILTAITLLATELGMARTWEPDGWVKLLIGANLAGFVWRAAFRFAFTAREYGWMEGVRAVLRIPVANIIAIMAGRKALFAYIRTLRGEEARWDKTAHDLHPSVLPSLEEQTPEPIPVPAEPRVAGAAR